MLRNKSIFISGGTGSFGNAFVKNVIENYKKVKRLVIFSRDEFKQYEMSKIFPIKKYPFIRYFLGDVRDLSRLTFALKEIDVVIHAAALKHVPAAEYDPFEFIKTNVLGAQHIIDASIANKVQKVIALSTDKAVAPINLYGATKLCSDKLFLAANNITGNNPTTFSIVRYGNVMSSRGSVIPHFLTLKKNKKKLQLTDINMTRFHITLEQAVNTVIWSIDNCLGGEVVINKIPSIKLLDLIKALKSDYEIIGVRPGEKIHEELLQPSDSRSTLELKNYYVILSKYKNQDKISSFYKKKFSAKSVPDNFSYNSQENNFLSVNEIKNQIEKIKVL
jgi:UDP-N-acetylglucosamine 4,6-dehydratase (inverting)